MASRSARELMGTVWRREGDSAERFSCPTCGVERPCHRTRLQRRISILGRPLFRMGGPTVFLTCDYCGHAFDAAALASPTQGSGCFAEDEVALVSIVAAVILSDAAVREVEKEAAGAILRRYTGRDLTDPEVAQLLGSARTEWGDPMPRLERLSGLVPPRTRRSLVEAAYLVCTADGDLHRQESRLLDRIGDALDLGPREVRRAIAAARDARRSGEAP